MGEKNVFEGFVSISTFSPSGGDYNVIGASVVFAASVEAPLPGWYIASAQWTSSGAPKMVASQTRVDPSLPILPGQTPFEDTAYNLGAQTSPTIGFYWGEKPGVETISVKVTVKNSSLNLTDTANAQETFTVRGPGVQGDLTAEKQLRVNQQSQELVYQPGMDWASLSPKLPGQFYTVQLIEDGSSISYQNGQKGFLENTTAAPAPFPLLDVANNNTMFYPSPTRDGPTIPLPQAWGTGTMSETFTDYVMYQPTDGIYVPEGWFGWTIDASAKLTGQKTKLGQLEWAATTNTAEMDIPFSVDHNMWPVAWADLSMNYRLIQ
jgi:hypothetical protein